VTLFMMINLVVQRPAQSLAGIVMMLAGLVIYGLSHLYQRTNPWSS
jgi:basic amino acid/polyamine antiporter, APA family